MLLIIIIIEKLYALNLIGVFVISGTGFMFLNTFMGITFSSAPVSILKFVVFFLSFMYSSVNYLFCYTVFTFFFQYGVHVVVLIHMVDSVIYVQLMRIFVLASARFCETATLAAFSAVFVIC